MATGKDLRKAIKINDLTMDSAADILGVSRPTLYNWVNKEELDENVLHLVKDKLKIDLNSSRPPASFMEQRRNKKNEAAPYMVPFVPIPAQAGYVRAVDQAMFLDTLEHYALPPTVDPRGAIWRYWEVEGDSMEPNFRSGDIILTSFVHQMDWENLRNFYVYVIVTTERVLIKRVFCKNQLEWVLISDNEDVYEQQLLAIEDIKEVWVYRKTWSTRAAPHKTFEIKV